MTSRGGRQRSGLVFRGAFASGFAALTLVFVAPACEDVAPPPPFAFDAGTVTLPETGSTTPPSDLPEAGPNPSPPDASPDVAVVVPDAGVDSGPLPACDDGKIDPGELCDPLASCPTKCPAIACQLRTLVSGGTCTAKCVDGATQTACVNGDGCCPPGGQCNAINDDDCGSTCGNGIVEKSETCDPLSSCPSACAPVGCQLRTLQGAGTCNAQCVNGAMQTVCANGDGCCPAGCNANNDTDCGPGCGNNVIEAGETCDPLASCPAACPQVQCQLRTLQNPGTCSAQCVDAGQQTACVNNDGCCPSNCNANNDNDCAPKCGNSVVETGETCDPLTSCPSACPPVACQQYKLDNGGTCQAVCTAAGVQTKCVHGDGCCPNGCDANTDNDCPAKCGNGVLEPGETCDPPGSCPKCSEQYTCYAATGTPATCDVVCHVPVTKCGTSGDMCCPFDGAGGCDSTTDKECAGGAWKFMVWPTPVDTTKGCVSVAIHSISPGSSYDITTCAPPGNGTGTGDPNIASVVDQKGTAYSVGNDNCTEKTALPLLAKSDCNNKAGQPTMACASPSPGGFLAQTGTSSFTVTICPAVGPAGTGGVTPLYIWYNSPAQPTTK